MVLNLLRRVDRQRLDGRHCFPVPARGAKLCYGWPKTGDRNVTPFLARTLTWAEIANGTSIVFGLRITAVAGEVEGETQGRFVAEAVRIVGAFLLEQGAGLT